MCDNKRIVMCGCHVIAEHLIEPLILAGVKFCHFIALTPEQAERYSISGYFDLSVRPKTC